MFLLGLIASLSIHQNELHPCLDPLVRLGDTALFLDIEDDHQLVSPLLPNPWPMRPIDLSNTVQTFRNPAPNPENSPTWIIKGFVYNRTFDDYIAEIDERKTEKKAHPVSRLRPYDRGLFFNAADFRDKVWVDLGGGASNFADKVTQYYGGHAFSVDWIFHPRFGSEAQAPYRHQDLLRTAKRGDFLETINWRLRIGASLTRLPFRDHSVDVLVENQSLYYLQGDERLAAWAEIGRVLRYGGRVLFSLETLPFELPLTINFRRAPDFGYQLKKPDP